MHEMKTPEPGKALERAPNEVSTTITHFMNSLSTRKSRLNLLRGSAALAAAGIAAGGMATNAFAHAAHTTVPDGGSPLPKHFDVVESGEALAATFYQLGTTPESLESLGLDHDGVLADTLKAIRIEEELHRKLAHALGSTPTTTTQKFTFSFPHGQQTFTNLEFFLDTMKTIEELTNGALLQLLFDAASVHGSARLVQLVGQITEVEGSHRIVERVIRAAHLPKGKDTGDPLANWAFAPVTNLNNFIKAVSAAVKAQGFLSPQANNSFTYQPLTDADLQIQIQTLHIANTTLPTL